MIFHNQLSATAPGTADGLNIGCKDRCGFQSETVGASGNLVVGNTSDSNDRYGFAQAAGNPNNLFLHNHATGNGVADFNLDP